MKNTVQSLFVAILIAAGSAARSETIDLSDIPAYPNVWTSNSAEEQSEVKRDIVLLDLDLLEIVGALGAFDRVLARPRVGDMTVPDTIPYVFKERPGTEGIMAMRPSIVIASNPRYNRLRDQLDHLGQDTMLIDQSLPAIEKITLLAEVLGLQERGKHLSELVLRDYEDATELRLHGDPLKIIHVSRYGSGGNFAVGGMATPVDNLIKRVGAENPAGTIGLDRYRRATQEGIINMRPDVVLFAEVEIPNVGGLESLWSDFPGLSYTPAGKNKRVIVMRNMHVRADAASSGIATLALANALRLMFPQ